MATVFTNAGKAITANRVKGSGTEPNNSGIGTGAGTATAADTTLFTETGTRVAGTSTVVTTTVTNDTYQVVATHSPGAITVTNAGLFDATSGGNLFLKGDFTGIPLGASDSLQLTYQNKYA